MKSGVIDPTKVSRIALENAASIASMMLTTECVIADEPGEEPANATYGWWNARWYARNDVKTLITILKSLDLSGLFFLSNIVN